jgi:hypothetical protein
VVEHLRTEAARKAPCRARRLFSAAIKILNDAIISIARRLITGWIGRRGLFGYTAANRRPAHLADRAGGPAAVVTSSADQLGETIEQNKPYLRGDGTSVEVALSISPVKAASGAIINIWTARDITEWNRTQHALQQQIEERRLRNFAGLILVTNAMGILVRSVPVPPPSWDTRRRRCSVAARSTSPLPRISACQPEHAPKGRTRTETISRCVHRTDGS